MDKIIIYTNKNCGHCQQLKDELEKANLEFQNKITKENEDEWQSVVNLTGVPTVPTVLFNGEYFVPGRDFKITKQMVDRLKLYKANDYSESLKTFERLKTLNYNINIAFNRLDQLLRKIETKINTDEHKSTN